MNFSPYFNLKSPPYYYPTMDLLQLISTCKRQMQQIGADSDLQQLPAGVRTDLVERMEAARSAMLQAERLLAEENCEQSGVAKLRLWERKLLDMTLRNNLLNTKLGRNTLLLPCADICQMEDELNMGRELILEQKELRTLYRTVRTNMEETGANSLFIALGTLRWCERAGGRVYMAPLLLMPVNIVPMKGGAYAVRKRDEEVVMNITLTEFLRQQYDIEIEGITPLPQDAYGTDVRLVMHQVREAIQEREGWEVVEEALLGVFSFTKFVMWNDIHTHPTEVMQSDLVRSLVEGRLMMNAASDTVDARQMDRELMPEAVAVPVDADSSQLEALVAAAQGDSFVLYGPPGTGKSQTITNLIANAVYHNKRVLFVAQKKAALDVVHHRLGAIGLAPFCLELHSNKMEKHHFLQQLKEVIEVSEAAGSEDFQRASETLFVQRQQLINHVEALHKRQEVGYSISDCIDRFLATKTHPLELPKDFVKGKSREEVEALCEQIATLASSTNLLGIAPQEHPLRGFLPKYKAPTATNSYAAKYMTGEGVEKILTELPQIVEGVRKQIERGAAMKFLNKTTRQYLDIDYKWKKFAALATVDDALIDDIAALEVAVKRWNENLHLLPAWKAYAEQLGRLSEMGLADAVNLHLSGVEIAEIQRAFMAAAYQQMAQLLIQQCPILKDFNGVLFEQVIEKYRTLTQEFQQLTRQELVARLTSRLPVGALEPELSSQLTLLRKRIGNKGRGTSIRNIINQMPDLLPMLCPVMLMSPLSVAQYLEMDAPKFDLVVFDEASQMPTSEAVGSIARAKASIVVGDPQQMPPTNFFNANVTDEDEADIDDQESILDDCISLSMPSRYLGWHYRSKHESLIAFSNQQYYDSRLLTFPSADDQMQRVTWQHVDGVYDFGKTRTNRAEAEAIVAEAKKRLQETPERSLGIVAFSKQQSELIEDLLLSMLADNPELERKNQEAEEPLFVKNLENVQGDERDVILFSIGYGPDKEGKVSMNFGPLNKVGGERRLNVAVSRARYEMKVFSTLLPEQIDERRTQAQGVIDLKHFLKFAAQGTLLPSGEDVKQELQPSPLAQHIAQTLREHGYEVKTNIGSSAFRIDVGVVNPKNPGTYKLGIICDGEGYRRLKTARDREVVQPSVLKMLGWKVVRIWSVEWFLHPEVVTQNILKMLNE